MCIVHITTANVTDRKGALEACLLKKYSLSEVKSVDHIKKDISETIEKMISKISEVADSLNENEKAALKKNYLELSQDSLKNLQTLSEDLDDIKKYLNYIKRKNAN